jgi:hypothetical protein
MLATPISMVNYRLTTPLSRTTRYHGNIYFNAYRPTSGSHGNAFKKTICEFHKKQISYAVSIAFLVIVVNASSNLSSCIKQIILQCVAFFSLLEIPNTKYSKENKTDNFK